MKMKACSRMGVLIGSLIGLSLLSSCGKESYLYVMKQSPHTDQSFKVKEMKGANAVDVLWVIDNSGSMDTFQQQVISNANNFMQGFIKEKLNWKMGVISTSSSQLPYGGFVNGPALDSTLKDPVGDFAQVIRRLGTSGDSTEMTFTPIVGALTKDPTFLRSNGPLAIIMVTDAPEQSRLTAANFITQLANLSNGRNVFAYGAYAARDLGCTSSEGSWNYVGSPYEAFIKSAFAGQAYPLCKDFGTALVSIAQDIVTRIAYSAIYLKGRPNTDTLQVLYQGKPLPAGHTEDGGYWLYDFRLNAIVFNNLDFAKNDTDSVRVLYEELQ